MPVGLVALLSILNIFQVAQCNFGVLWTERGNWAYYKESFGETKRSERILTAFESREVQPPEKMNKLRQLIDYPVWDSTVQEFVRLGGRAAYRCVKEFNCKYEFGNDALQVTGGDWLRITVDALIPHDAARPSIDGVPKLIVDFTDSRGRTLKYRGISIPSHLDNPDFSLWQTHGTGKWGEAAFFVMIPVKFEAGSLLRVYVWNPNGQELYVSKLGIELWR
jgi:hypothetical protein